METAPSVPNESDIGGNSQNTEVLYGQEAILQKSIQVFMNVKETLDSCLDASGPSIITKVELLMHLSREASARGVRNRIVTEITKGNLSDCKELMKIVQLRHMDGIRGNFNISDRKFYGGGGGKDTGEGKFPSHYIYSNVTAFVDQQQYLFDMLWNKAIPAEEKIKEIEQGITLGRTDIIQGLDKIVKSTFEAAGDTKRTIDNCVDSRTPESFVKMTDIWNMLVGLTNRGVKLRFITEVSSRNVEYCKELAKIADLKHIDNISGNFGIHDGTLYRATASGNPDGVPPDIVVTTTSHEFVSQQQYFFDLLWNKAVPFSQRIKEIEDQEEPEFLEVVTDTQKGALIISEYVKSIAHEAIGLIPNSETILRMEKAGFVEHLMRAANNGAKVRAICPITPSNENVIKRLSESPNITILNGEPMTSGFFVLDNKRYFRADTRNPDTENNSEALGFLEYSNSKSRIESYKTFFEIIWKQLQSYRALQEHNRTQNEFISIAAHELKNPIQPILGLAQVLSDKATQQDKHLLDIIVRNAKKLADMQDNILDVTRIDSNNLRLRKENVNIKNMINDVVLSYKNQPGIELKVEVADAFANVDIDRISQVLSNLLSNAIKYTENAIVIKLVKDSDMLVVTVQDDGEGIEPENLPKVFTKFFTTSEKGTGLGLFISKSIVEAHGGKIWAQNNHGKGATFGFSLPLE